MTNDEPKFYAQEIYPSTRGLHFKFGDLLEAQKFYLHLQHKGARAVLEGKQVTIHSGKISTESSRQQIND